MSRWTEDYTLKFVEEYLKKECLWNFKSLCYRNKQAKQQAMIDIASSMDITNFGIKEVEQKIRSIRSTYSQEMRKIKESCKSGAGADQIYKPNIKWFSLMDETLKSVSVQTRKTHNNLNGTETDMDTMAFGDQSNKENNLDSMASSSSSQNISSNTASSNDTPSTQEKELAKNVISSRKRNIKCLENLVNKVKAVGEMVQSQNTVCNNNEFEIFGKSVATQLNAMPLTLALQGQAHIQHYLTCLRLHTAETAPPPPASTVYVSSPIPTESVPPPELVEVVIEDELEDNDVEQIRLFEEMSSKSKQVKQEAQSHLGDHRGQGARCAFRWSYTNNHSSRDAHTVRDDYADYFVEGSVDWKIRMVV